MMIKTNRYLTERKELDNMFIIIYDFSMAVLMFLFGIYFYKSKGKAARFLSGYNMKSEEERKKYDENAMCKAYGKRMMVMSLPFIVGIIIDIQYQGTGCLIAWMIWLIMFISLLIDRHKKRTINSRLLGSRRERKIGILLSMTRMKNRYRCACFHKRCVT